MFRCFSAACEALHLKIGVSGLGALGFRGLEFSSWGLRLPLGRLGIYGNGKNLPKNSHVL